MTYESTGEVRPPQQGEYFLAEFDGARFVTLARSNWKYNERPIMRPLTEEENTK